LGRPTLSESESKELLAAWGVGSARAHRANSAEAAVEAAEQLGFPVALTQVRTAYAEILASAKAHAAQARIIGVSVQEMVGEGVEVIIGVSCDHSSSSTSTDAGCHTWCKRIGFVRVVAGDK
jgi:acetyltransferase